MPINTLLYDYARGVVHEIITSPINSKFGIKLSLDKPLNNDIDLNILRPAVLRQYYGKEVDIQLTKSKRYTYGSGTGTTSVGMDSNNFVTRAMNKMMLDMADHIYRMLNSNKSLFNVQDLNMSNGFNHCTILLYYAGKGLKQHSSLGYHTDCVYSVNSGKFKEKANSQAKNTPAVIYSIGSSRMLHYKSRKIIKNERGRNIWVPKDDDKMTFEIGTDTLSIINPLDEDPLSEKNKSDMTQYLHGGINVSGEKLSVAMVYRIVSQTYMYNLSDDTLHHENTDGQGDVVNGILGIDLGRFHTKLLSLYHKTLL